MLDFNFKKIISLILVLVFMIGFLPALAQDPSTDPSATVKDSQLGTSIIKPIVTDVGGDNAQSGVQPVVKTHDTTTLTNTKKETFSRTTYTLLEPIGGFESFDNVASCPFVRYLNIMIRIFLGICALLAMLMIIAGGIEYMTSELPAVKGDGKSRILNAIFGLVLALAAYAILNTVNPKLLDLCPKIPQATLNFIEENSIFDKPRTAENIARCTEIVDPSHPCHPTNLEKYFGDKASAMSKICNIESAGKADIESKTDKGTDGKSFSFGLLQINLLANGVYVGPECTGLFMTSSSGQNIPPAKYHQKDANGKVYYDAMLKPGKEAQYNACKERLKDPKTNLEIAKKLFDIGSQKWGNMHAWHGDYCVCSSAFDKGSKDCY